MRVNFIGDFSNPERQRSASAHLVNLMVNAGIDMKKTDLSFTVTVINNTVTSILPVTTDSELYAHALIILGQDDTAL